MKKAVLFVMLAFGLFSAQLFAQINIDGLFTDWATTSATHIDTVYTWPVETVGDASVDPNNPNKYVDTDLKDIFVTDDSLNIYLEIVFNPQADLTKLQDSTLYNGFANVSIYVDADQSDSTGLDWGFWHGGYDYAIPITELYPGDTTAYKIIKYAGSNESGSDWMWDNTGETCTSIISLTPPYNKIEVQIPKTAFAGMNPTMNDLRFMVFVQEQFNPWGGDFAPNDLADYAYDYQFQNLADAGITIDGLFTDWDSDTLKTQVDVPETWPVEDIGDASVDPNNPNKYVDTDLQDIYVTDDSANVYFHIKMNPNADLTKLQDSTLYNGFANISIYVDEDLSNKTGLDWGWWKGGYDLAAAITELFPGDTTAFHINQYAGSNESGADWIWNDTGLSVTSAISVLPPYNEIEVAFPRAALGQYASMNKIGFMVFAQEQFNPWGGDYAPNDLGGHLYVYKCSSDYIPTAVREHGNSTTIPEGFNVSQNYPNPFNPTTAFKYTLPKASHVEISIYNLMGQKIATLVNANIAAGTYQVKWDGRNSHGNLVPSGLYFYEVRTPAFRQIGKMILSK